MLKAQLFSPSQPENCHLSFKSQTELSLLVHHNREESSCRQRFALGYTQEMPQTLLRAVQLLMRGMADSSGASNASSYSAPAAARRDLKVSLVSTSAGAADRAAQLKCHIWQGWSPGRSHQGSAAALLCLLAAQPAGSSARSSGWLLFAKLLGISRHKLCTRYQRN